MILPSRLKCARAKSGLVTVAGSDRTVAAFPIAMHHRWILPIYGLRPMLARAKNPMMPSGSVSAGPVTTNSIGSVLRGSRASIRSIYRPWPLSLSD